MPKDDKPEKKVKDDEDIVIHNPYAVEPRRRLTAKQKVEMFLRHDGKCCVCGEKINSVHEAWDEHVNPLWLNGDNTADNRAPAHEKCARDKTSREARQRSGVRKVAAKHLGARTPKTRPMPGSKKSPWKKKMDGTVERRK